MTIDLYYNPGMSSSRTVLLTAKAIGIELNLKPIDVFKQEHLTPEYTAINPQHSAPTINDNGFILWESKAIITYLQNQYGKNDSLYPKDPKKRALVDQRLYFAIDLYSRFHDVYNISTFKGEAPSPEKVELANTYLEFLDAFLEKSQFVAGENLTLADLSLVVEISNLDLLKHDLSPYKNINRWYAKVKKTAPGYKEANEDQFGAVQEIIEKLAKSD